MRTADVITASLLMAIGGIVLVDAVRLGFRWGTDGPESGFFPFLLATILVVSCAVIILRAAIDKSSKAFATRQQLVLVLKVLLPAGGMVLLTQFIGLYVAAVLYMAFYMRWVGKHSWPTTVLLPLTVSLLTFVVFVKFFLVPLPKGPLETWLGY